MTKLVALILALLCATSTFGQDAAALQKQLDEMRQQIDVLSREIEALKNNQQKPTATVEANTTTYGLGAAASKVYRTENGVSFGGYGEFRYENLRGIETNATLERAVLYTGYKFGPRAVFNSELEVEDASTERGGNVSIEFAYLDYLLRPSVNARAGLMLMPMGLVNEQHEPTAYFGVERSLTEQFIIPSTWSELGAGVFGDSGSLSYRGYLVAALDADAFANGTVLREGRQAGVAINPGLAGVGRLDWHPVEGTMIGGSLYHGNTGEPLTIAEAHADARFRGVTLRGLVASATLGNAGRFSLPHNFSGWYAEGGYELPHAITPYVRYEQLKFFSSDSVSTFGVAWRPFTQSVIKVDYERRPSDETFRLGLGYIF
jgi:hypothetical protein